MDFLRGTPEQQAHSHEVVMQTYQNVIDMPIEQKIGVVILVVIMFIILRWLEKGNKQSIYR